MFDWIEPLGWLWFLISLGSWICLRRITRNYKSKNDSGTAALVRFKGICGVFESLLTASLIFLLIAVT